MPKISVIVPVYNAGLYIEKCLKSLLLQTYENLEIICVDDGSKDNSLDILKKYKDMDDRIVIIEKENGGASTARNCGLKAATGDYISFVDADDWVNITLYEVFAESCKKSTVDIWTFNMGFYGFKKGESNKAVLKNPIKLDYWDKWKSADTVLTFDDCNNPFYTGMSVCNKIYRTEFLRKHNLEFYEGIIFEDTLFNLQSLLKSESLKITPDIFYWYNQANAESVTKTYDEKVFDAFIIIAEIQKCLRELHLSDIYKYAFFQYKYDFLATLYMKTKFKLLKRFYKKMKECCVVPAEIKSMDLKLCRHLKNYIIFEKLQTCGWHEFYTFLKNNTA